MDYINIGNYTINKNAIAFIDWDCFSREKMIRVAFCVASGIETEMSAESLYFPYYSEAAQTLAAAFGQNLKVYEFRAETE